MLNLDTHILIHAVAGSLRDHEEELLRANAWGVSCIVLWEIAKLHQLGRISVDLRLPEIQTALTRIHVWPIDSRIASTSVRLDFRGDPADAFIAATSVVHGVPLVTRDHRIRESRMVPLADG